MARRKKSRQPVYEEVEFHSLSAETKKGLVVVLLFILAIISVLSFLNLAGKAGGYVDYGLGVAFGWGRYIVPLILIGLGYVLARGERYRITIANYFGVALFVLSIHALLHLRLPLSTSYELSFSGLGGGLLGFGASYFLLTYLGFWASIILLIGILFSSVLLMFNTSIERFFQRINIFKLFQPLFSGSGDLNEDADLTEEVADSTEGENAEAVETVPAGQETQGREVKFSNKEIAAGKKPEVQQGIKPSHIKIDLPLSLLDNRISKPTSGDIQAGKERIQHTLENFNIPVEMGDVQVGPTVTQFTLRPADGIKLAKITSLSNDLALALAAHPIRIEAPIPGKALVGVEVPNQKPAIVRLREALESPDFKQRKSNLTIALGKDVSGHVWTADLPKMPHLLVAGATGSGKSVCLNSIIVSFLYQNNPDTLRLILVDPKRVEFPIYNGIPHLLTPVITDVTKTIYALRWAITEMDRRFDVLAAVKKRNIEDYNKLEKEKMPYIVIIIDELADLMINAAAEVEGCIIRLTQMARAVGIHLIVATQRPSVNVITGLIKANMPCRIAFSVASLMDSRTILDTSGAEKLVGKGDALFMTPTTAKPRRLQQAYVGDDEIKRVVDFLKHACKDEPQYVSAVVSKPQSGGSSFDFQGGGDDGDDLLNEAKDIVVQAGKASASLLQRRLRVGYSRAARLIDLMEEAGIVGPADGAKPRDILVDKESAMNTDFSDNTADGADDIEEEIDSTDEEIAEDEETDLTDEEVNATDDEKTEELKNEKTSEKVEEIKKEEMIAPLEVQADNADEEDEEDDDDQVEEVEKDNTIEPIKEDAPRKKSGEDEEIY